MISRNIQKIFRGFKYKKNSQAYLYSTTPNDFNLDQTSETNGVNSNEIPLIPDVKLNGTPPVDADKPDNLSKIKIPSRMNAFFSPVVAIPSTLNLEESTTTIYRLMKLGELSSIINSNVMGNKPSKTSYYNMGKRSHLYMPEHVQENNSRLLLSFAQDPEKAANYAGVEIMPNVYALVQTNLPPVFTVPSTHARLDQAEFDAYHVMHMATTTQANARSAYNHKTPVNPAILCKEQKEVDMVINTPNGDCDFRPQTDEMVRQINYLVGAMRQYTFVSDPSPVIFENFMQRDWAIEVLCPANDGNYYKMLATARDSGLIPPGSRPLTVDDAVVLFPVFMYEFPATLKPSSSHVHVLKNVPEHIPIGSPELIKFLHAEHSLFRQKHENGVQCHSHDYVEMNRHNRNRS